MCFFLLFFLILTFYCIYLAQFVLLIFLTSSVKYHYLIEFGKKLSGCSHVRFSQMPFYAVFILHKYFLLSNTHQDEMKSNLPTALEIMYLSSLSIIFITFETFAVHLTITGWPYFAASLT